MPMGCTREHRRSSRVSVDVFAVPTATYSIFILPHPHDGLCCLSNLPYPLSTDEIDTDSFDERKLGFNVAALPTIPSKWGHVQGGTGGASLGKFGRRVNFKSAVECAHCLSNLSKQYCPHQDRMHVKGAGSLRN